MRIGKTDFFYLLITFLLFFNLGAYSPARNVEKAEKSIDDIPLIDTSFYPFLRSEIEKLWEQTVKDGFSGTMLVVHENNIVFEKFHTRKYRYIKDTVTDSSRFEIASVSKQFTAVAILQLYERGLLDLNDSVRKFIPDFPYKGITIHSLLCHRAGLPNYIYYLSSIKTDLQKPFSPDSLFDLWRKNPPSAYHIPNRRFKYSNTGYVVLAKIVEIVSGLSFDEYLQKNIFEPLGMKNTTLRIAGKTDSIPNRITGYSQYWRDAREDYLNGCYGDKGIHSTARDLAIWDQALYDTVVLSPKTLELAFLPHGKPQNSQSNYGYGWRLFFTENFPIYYHTGWWQGFRSLLVRFPNHRITVVVLKHTINGRIPKVDDFYRIMKRCFLPTLYSPSETPDTLPSGIEDDENNDKHHVES